MIFFPFKSEPPFILFSVFADFFLSPDYLAANQPLSPRGLRPIAGRLPLKFPSNQQIGLPSNRPLSPRAKGVASNHTARRSLGGQSGAVSRGAWRPITDQLPLLKQKLAAANTFSLLFANGETFQVTFFVKFFIFLFILLEVSTLQWYLFPGAKYMLT